MKQVGSTVWIDALPERVWAVLTDAPGLVAADLGITRLDGVIQQGARIKLWADVAPGRAFALKVTQPTPERQMIWTGGMPLGLFTGRRVFDLTPARGGTQLAVTETFTGLLSGLIWKTMPDLQPSFDRFTTGMKSLCERSPA